MRIYVDNCVIGLIVDTAPEADELAAFVNITARSDLELVVSGKTSEELRRAQDRLKGQKLQILANLLKRVHSVQEISAAYGASAYGELPYAGEWTDPLLVGLRTIFEPDDADHVFQAARSGCRYFLTVDRRTILDRAAKHKADLTALCPDLDFVSPVTLEGLSRP